MNQVTTPELSRWRSDPTRVILLCFVASGMSGLVYQVIWVRELELVFGATTFAASTVLTAFMCGLALGSYYSGRWGVRLERPLRLYGLLEIGIGLYGLAVPVIFAALPWIYEPMWVRMRLSFLGLTIVRFLLATLVLIVPTALMGATLPVLSVYYVRGAGPIGRRVGRLYSLNTFGAVIGAGASGFLLIPALGMRGTTTAAAALNFVLGFVALQVSRRGRQAEIVPPAGDSPGGQDRSVRAGSKEATGRWPRLLSRLSFGGRTGSRRGRPNSEASPGVLSRAGRLSILAALAVSGFAALSYEVIWSRVLTLIIGSSVYAFSIMLVTFLTGLALGAAIFSRAADRIRKPIIGFAVVELAVGISSLGGAYLFNELPYVFISIYRWFSSSSLTVLLFARFLIASLVIIVPTLLLGALFPLAIRIVHQSREESPGSAPAGPGDERPDQAGESPSRTVGSVYAVNTLGAIAGAFASGFILIPLLGLGGSLRLAVALNISIAGVLFYIHWRGGPDARGKADARIVSGGAKGGRRPMRAGSVIRAARPLRYLAFLGSAVSAALLAAVVLFKPPWDVAVMSSAVYRYAPSVSQMNRNQFFDYFAHGGQGETVFYKEGITATIAVQRQEGGRVLKVNGKPDASTAGDLPTQVLIGSSPLLLREKTDDVLVIGLGSGVTLGSVEQYPVARVTCVELEPAVIEASHYFDDVNNRPLEDPRLRLVANDGRNFIDTTRERFDVIISEPSNPWLTGVANLFTLEYFKRGAERLKEGGVFSQWLQIYEMPPEDVKTLIATFRVAFPNVLLFRGAEGDLMLLGSKQALQLDLSAIRSHLGDSRVAADLNRVRVTSAADFISRFYMGTAELQRFAGGADINTDDNALIEFSAPRRVGISEDTVGRNVKELLAGAGSPLPYIGGDLIDDPEGAESGYFSAIRVFEGHEPADFLLEAALGAIKRNDLGRAEQLAGYSIDAAETVRARTILGEIKSALGDDEGGLDQWRRALEMDMRYIFALIDMGKYYLTRQDAAGAVQYLDRAIEVDPESARAHHLRGLASQLTGDSQRAIAEYRRALPDAKYTRSVKTFYLNFGTALTSLGLYEEAAVMLEEYERLAPADADAHYQLGSVYEVLAERSVDDSLTDRAVSQLKRTLEMRPDQPMAHYYLSKAYRRLGLYDQADAEFEIYRRLSAR